MPHFSIVNDFPRVSQRLRPAVAVGVLTVALVASSSAVAVGAPRTTAAVPAGRYVAVTPTRVLDTRTAGGPLADTQTRIVSLARAFTANAGAVVINLTVTAPTSAGYLVAYPAGTDKPLASSLNFSRGQTRANSVTVAVGQGSFQNQLAITAAVAGNGNAQVVVDVLGYYGAAGGAAGATYLPLPSPVRLFDTRRTIGGLTSTYPKNIGIVTLDYGSAAINRTITAAVMNITVTGTRGTGNLTLWNGYAAPPLVSTLNFVAGQTVANLAVVPVRCTDAACSTVTFSIKNNLSPYTQVIGDIAGIYTTPTPGGLVYQPLPPTRVTDTRLGQPYSRLGPAKVGVTDVSGVVPSGTRALNLNVTGVKPTIPTYLVVYPASSAKPGVSSLNPAAGDVVANAVQVKVGSDGRFATFNAAGSIDVVIDLEGTFVPDPGVSSSAPAATPGAATGASVSGAVSGG